MSLFLSLICLMMNIFLSITERRKTKTIFTPFFCFSILYSVIMTYVAILDVFKSNDEYRMSFMVPLVSILFFILFFSIGYGLYFSFGRKIEISRKIEPKIYIYRTIVALIIICLLFVFATYLLHFRRLIVSSGEFKSFFSSGIQGHIINVITVLFLYLFTSKKHKFLKLVAVAWAMVLALGSAKYMMIVYAVSLLMIFYFTRRRFSLLRLLTLLGIVGMLFIVTYILRAVFDDATVDLSFIFGHFNYYLTGSFYAFSKVLTTEIMPTDNVGIGIILAPIINIFKALSGNKNYVSSISQFISVDINSIYKSTNVFTAFGAVILETNMFTAILFVCVLSLISYLLLFNLMKHENACSVISYSVFMAFLFCTFFNCFYGTLNFIELFVVIILIQGLNMAVRTYMTNKKRMGSTSLISHEEETINYV